MVISPSKKQSVDKRIAYLNDQGWVEEGETLEEQIQKQLKQEGISDFKDRQNSGKSKRNNNGDELSVVTPSKSPKALQGHNNFGKINLLDYANS